MAAARGHAATSEMSKMLREFGVNDWGLPGPDGMTPCDFASLSDNPYIGWENGPQVPSKILTIGGQNSDPMKATMYSIAINRILYFW
jgi:hypothetical protein